MSLVNFLSEASISGGSELILSPEEFVQFRDDFENFFSVDVTPLVENPDVLETNEDLVENRGVKGKKKKKPSALSKEIKIKFDRNIDKRFAELIELGKDMRYWYESINDGIFGALSESNGSLFLLLLASTSASTMLTRNFIEASKVYMGLQYDFINNRENLEEYFGGDLTAKNFTYDSNPYELEVIEQMRKTSLMYAGAKINNIRKTVMFWLNNDGVITKDSALNFLISNYNINSPTKIAILSGDTLNRMKIFNFAVNLLSPEYAIKNGVSNWYFVTIDKWMLRVFFPHLSEKELEKFFANSTKYLRLTQKIQVVAKKYGMLPHQVQAMIWVGKFRQEGKSVESFERVIDSYIDDAFTDITTFKDIYEKVRYTIDMLTDLDYTYDPEGKSKKIEPDSIVKPEDYDNPFLYDD
jgi:hypothetical protein